MKNGLRLCMVVVLTLLVSAGAYAVDNSGATYVLDFDTTTAAIDGPGTISKGDTFDVDVVLIDAVQIIGVNSDIRFATEDLKVNSISEKKGDLNFDGISNLIDLSILGTSFGSTTGEDNYEAAYDVLGDGEIGLIELSNLGTGFNKDSRYWTDHQVADGTTDATGHESVEIFDPVATINANGLIDDLVSVLLIRPNDQIGDDSSDSFTGNAIIATITFQVLETSGASTEIKFENPVVLDVDDDVANPTDCAATNSIITIQ